MKVTVTLDLYITGDGSDSKILQRVVIHSTGTRNFENDDSALFECGDSNDSGAGNSQKGDGKTVLGDGKTVLGDGKTVLGDGKTVLGDGKTVLGDGRIALGDSKLMKIKVGA